MKISYLFVYGTLKKNFSNHHFLRNCQFIDLAKTNGELYNTSYYPIACSGSGFVKGEIYKIKNNNIWKNIDLLKGHPTFYKREIKSVILKDGRIIDAWVYLMPKHYILKNNFTKIKTGAWRPWPKP